VQAENSLPPLALIASADTFDVGVSQSAAVGVTFFFFACATCSPQQRDRSVFCLAYFFPAVLELNFDGSRIAGAENADDRTVEHSRRHCTTHFVSYPEIGSVGLVHS
jgi:hypothetical protein